MRPQLLGGGLLVGLTGVAFYLTQLPLLFTWSIPFMGVGAIMAVASLLLPEGGGPLQPPEGYRFCVFCSTPVKMGVERCSHCNGVQPTEAR